MSLPAVGAEKIRGISPRRKFEGHTEWVSGVIHLPVGQRIMTCSEDGSLRMWNLRSGEQIGKDWRDGENEVNAIALSPDGKQVVSGSGDGAVKLWDIDTGKVITKWTGHTDDVASVRWNRNGERVLSGSWDGTARVWDAKSGETILAIKTGLFVYSAIYSPDETMIATGGNSENEDIEEEGIEEKEEEEEEEDIEGDEEDEEEDIEEEKEDIKIFDAKTGKLVANLKGHRQQVNCLAWTADGTTLISGSEDESVRTWNTTTWQQINVFTGHTRTIFAIAICPSGRILASASWDKTARLWNLENGQPIASPLHHANDVNCVSFSTDGKLLATGCDDHNAYTWDIPTIFREAGLNELLLNSNDGHKSSLEADTIRRPAQRRRRDNIDPRADRLPPGFFDDSPHHPPASRTRPRSTSSARQHHVAGDLSSDRRGILGRLSSLFRPDNYNTQDAPPRTRLLERVPNPFSRTPRMRHDEGIELQERRPTVVDVPFTRGKPRNISAAQVRMKKEKERAKNAKNAYAGSSQPLQGSITQPSGGAAQVRSFKEPHAAAATPDVAASSAVTMLTTSTH